MIERALCEAAFHDAVRACDPAARVRDALARAPVSGRHVIGLAVGKAAVAMAHGAGAVARGLVVTVADDPRTLPAGWSVRVAGHPLPDQRSLAAGAEVIGLVDSAGPDDVVLALISGGASALIEQPAEGVSFDSYRERVRERMASGASIHELNALRTQLSAIKGGKLAARSAAPVVSLIVSDVVGDDPRVIGSGPTVRAGDRVAVIAPMSGFGEAITEALVARGLAARRIAEPVIGDPAVVADLLTSEPGVPGVIVAWGEPTVRLPADHGEGGRAQHVALELARRLRGTDRSAFVIGSDGVDGSSRAGAAGAYVDGSTWDAMIARGLDPEGALRRCDSAAVLGSARVITGPTGINHGDVMIFG